ncbi:hypothetical protein OHA77_18495 [Streptosporangium sp. NBC_01639]|uniref:hypothetical protein n=1 Tax=Streptosporangium sp. NBC_01639 TaxID=2975948 RepID=UPI0038672487|nr:hypothetical protein OHA77_18495 [Streptosporangium sp. NBC_01639]
MSLNPGVRESIPALRETRDVPCPPSKEDEKRYEPGWAARTHAVTFWVFPPDAPILKGPESRDRRAKVCDGRYVLDSPENADRLAAMLGSRPGAWSVAVYDAPAG